MYNKVDFGASDFEAAVLLQIEVKRKMLGRSVTFEPRSVEKHFQQQNFFELTTPSPDCFSDLKTGKKWLSYGQFSNGRLNDSSVYHGGCKRSIRASWEPKMI